MGSHIAWSHHNPGLQLIYHGTSRAFQQGTSQGNDLMQKNRNQDLFFLPQDTPDDLPVPYLVLSSVKPSILMTTPGLDPTMASAGSSAAKANTSQPPTFWYAAGLHAPSRGLEVCQPSLDSSTG